MSMLDHVSLQLFCMGLDVYSPMYLDIVFIGSFENKTMAEGKEILGFLYENTSMIVYM